MMRTLLILAAASVASAPPMIAQNPSVCVFQQKQRHTKDTDAVAVANALTARKASGGPAFDYVSVSGFTSKEIEAEAQRRNCTWVLTLWRQAPPPDTPNYAGTLGGSDSSAGVLGKAQGGNVNGVTNSIVAGNPAMQDAAQDGTMLEYTLRKGDSHKAVAHGSSDQQPIYDPVVAAIVKKLDKEK
jgi:hypothetical protein